MECASPTFCIHIASSPAVYNKCANGNVERLFRAYFSLILFLDYSYSLKYTRNEANWNLIRKEHASYYMHPPFMHESLVELQNRPDSIIAYSSKKLIFFPSLWFKVLDLYPQDLCLLERQN